LLPSWSPVSSATTWLAGANEDRILARLRALRGNLIDPTIAVHHGRIVKRTSDDSLIRSWSTPSPAPSNGLIDRNVFAPCAMSCLRAARTPSRRGWRRNSASPASADIAAGRSDMSDPTLPSFRYRLEQQPPRTDCGGVVRGASIRQFPVARASPALLCAYNPVAGANSMGTRLPPSWVTSCRAVVAPPY
jgi:hypothetical protein